ncbi:MULTISPECIES: hypothetical protein [unclassified Microcoleus]|uniref:hypothetical protein n=1 Tax=unclassified Microcoleus TaxID=2642155 RepID=UPI002FD4589B
MHNTFTYRHSDLPSIRPEIKAEIVALGLHADDLILKSQGNYRELEELAETLSNSLDTCELNLQSIRVIPDDSPQPTAISLQDLPIELKQLIWSCSYTNSLLLKCLSAQRNITHEELVAEINKHSAIYARVPTVKEAEQFVDELTEANNSGDKNFFLKRMWRP